MRKITEIILHCSATEQGRVYHASDIDRWHREQGWSGIGYHFVVLPDGSLETGRPLQQPGAHCRGHNGCSVGVCYIGGLRGGIPADTRTPEQKRALRRLVKLLLQRFPDAKVYGHRDFNPHKACPCFDVREMGFL